jgi:hypothetical protein
VGLTLLAIALGVTSLASYRLFREDQDRLIDRVRETRVIAWDPQLAEEIEREPDPQRARLKLARSLLASAMEEPGETPGTDGGVADDGDDVRRRLALARDLAAGVARERPSAWEAPMVQGAATYLGWRLARDPRLLTSYPDWEEPLRRSLELAPGRPEPARFLATAYLELWPALSQGKQAEARALLRRILGHRPTFEALIAAWLQRAGSAEEAFSAIPDEPWAWERLQQIYADRTDWQSCRLARLRWYGAYQRTLRRDLTEAEARLRGGDTPGATLLFLTTLSAPPRRLFEPVAESALAQLPPEAGPGNAAPSIRSWLDWALDLCLTRGCPMAPPVLRRLAGLSGDTDVPRAALSALVTGDLAEAESVERRAGDLSAPAWSAYRAAKVRKLAEADDLEDARAAFAEIPAAERESAAYWRAARSLAHAGGDAAGEAEAEKRLEAMRRDAWPLTEWTWRERVARLEILPDAPASGLEAQIFGPDRGAVAELRLDGEVVAVAALTPNAVVRVRRPIDAGPHVLEVQSATGGQIAAGPVRLLRAP